MRKHLKIIGISLLALLAVPVAIRAGLESATYVGDLVASNPTNSDLVSAGDDHIRLLKSTLQATFPNALKAFYFPGTSAKTTTYTVVAADMNDLITADASGGAFTITLPTLASGDDGWQVTIQKIDTSASVVTVAGTIESLTNYALSAQWDAATFQWTGTAWNVVSTRGAIDRIATKTASATLATSEFESTILVSPASNTTLTLPAAANRKGRWYNIKRTCSTAFTVTIDGNASETIDGETTVPVWACGSVRLVGDGTNWFIAESGGRLGRPAPGTLTDHGGGTLPVGALAAYGQAVSRTTYADLFAQIGTTYGVGDGSTTFNMPDTRGRVTVGEDDMGGSSANRLTDAEADSLNGDTLGDTGGVETQTPSAAESGVAAHQHFILSNVSGNATEDFPTASEYMAKENETGGQQGYDSFGTATAATLGLTSQNTAAAASEAHAVVQPSIVVQKVIWY